MKYLISWFGVQKDFTDGGLQIDPNGFTNSLHRDIFEQHNYDKHILLTLRDDEEPFSKKKNMLRWLKEQYLNHSVEFRHLEMDTQDLNNYGVIEDQIRSIIQTFDAQHKLDVIAGIGPTALNMALSILNAVMPDRFNLYLMQRPEHSKDKNPKHELIPVIPYKNAFFDRKLMEHRFNNEIPTEIFKDEIIEREYEKALTYAKSTDPVLILGETGSGKDVMASFIHNQSPLKNKSFMAINCASLQDSVLYSELFGHEKGAFTGAEKEHKGLFETYKDGTLFLDEIGDISPFMQQSLLRALQNKQIKKLGSNKLIEGISPRIIAATNRDLYKLAEEGKFRMDLYFRLCDMEIELVPYRTRNIEQRKTAITHFIKKGELKWGYTINISTNTKSIIEDYSFPGNFREIWSVCNGLFIWKDQLIEPQMLPKRMINNKIQLSEDYQQVMKQHCEAIYKKYNYDLSLTCKALGYKNITQLKRRFEVIGIFSKEKQ